ncbi:hypothetical protein [Lacrimispora sp.]|uniref:hypothetical protein n=1 Tax=Lacrimispora sp. TaxID=2719234 RepID=UPI0032E4DC4D
MKHKHFLRKPLFLFLSTIFLSSLNACGQKSTTTLETTDTLPASSELIKVSSEQPSDSSSAQISAVEPSSKRNESSAYNEALAAYNNFLSGSMNAQDLKHEISDGVVKIKDISLETDFKTYYALFDMNGDGIPELHLRPAVGGSYLIFTYLDGQIVLWHSGPDYESPLNNGAILYQRDGAAPTHINYYYLVLDSNGKETSKVNFSKYHSVDESVKTESTDYDVFMMEDKEVSEEEWNSLTKDYLSNSSDIIVWKEI